MDQDLYVKLDDAACRALHLGLNTQEKEKSSTVTLFSTIDKCRTTQGHRLLTHYLQHPLLDKDKLEERLDLVEILVEDTVLRKSLHDDNLRRIPDCQALSKKLGNKKGMLQDYYKGYLCVSKLGRFVETLDRFEGEKKSVLDAVFTEPLKSLHEEFKPFVQLIENTIDLELADRGDFVVRADYDEGLGELRDKMNSLEAKMKRQAQSVAENLGLEFTKSLKFEYNDMHGHYYRITLKEEASIRNHKDYKILDTNKAGVRFRDDELTNLTQKFSKHHKLYEEKQKDFVKDLVDVASDYNQLFEQLGELTATIDVITSFAVSSVDNAPEMYVRPKLLPRGSGKLHFTNLRHPCVETQSGVTYIPNNINFEKGNESFYIITGPNMGGKSTFLRSVGVATLLAHVGCFVPASYAEVSMVDAIMARVGAGDSLAKGVSTFMTEMIESSSILKTATSDSLVLIDELGRGTSTYDGFGICWALSEHLAEKVDCFCILATHFHELTDLASQIPTVKNLHVVSTANEMGLEMLYTLRPGSCDRSFGLHVAKVTGFPEKVLEDAQNMVRRLEDFSSEHDLDETDEGVARRKLEKKTGMEIINQFFKNMNDLAEQTTDEEVFQTELATLIDKVKETENPYVRHILSTIE